MIIIRKLYSEQKDEENLTPEEKNKILKKARDMGIILSGTGGSMLLLNRAWEKSKGEKATDPKKAKRFKIGSGITFLTGTGLAIGSEVLRRKLKKQAAEEKEKESKKEEKSKLKEKKSEEKEKSYADLQQESIELSPREQQLEEFKMQRQRLISDRQTQKLEEQKRRDKIKRIAQSQQLEAEKDEQAMKNQIKVKKLEQDNDNKQSASLYKVQSRAINPVPMKI